MFKQRKIQRIKEHQRITCTEAKRYSEMKQDIEANIPLVNEGYTKEFLQDQLSHTTHMADIFERECEKNNTELRHLDH